VHLFCGFTIRPPRPNITLKNVAVRFKPLLLILKARNKSHDSTPFLLCSNNITNRKWHGTAQVVANNGNRTNTEFPALARR
tara:strand:+ start:9983 stop:10225 length:243 start_codon:yes stop_codon:yes gene_type:complete